MKLCRNLRHSNPASIERWSVAQWSRHCIIKLTVAESIRADVTAFTDFVHFSKVFKPDYLFPTHGCAEAFILQWIDTVWNLFSCIFCIIIFQHYYVKIFLFKRIDQISSSSYTIDLFVSLEEFAFTFLA